MSAVQTANGATGDGSLWAFPHYGTYLQLCAAAFEQENLHSAGFTFELEQL